MKCPCHVKTTKTVNNHFLNTMTSSSHCLLLHPATALLAMPKCKKQSEDTKYTFISSKEVNSRVQVAHEDFAGRYYVKRTYTNYIPPLSPQKNSATSGCEGEHNFSELNLPDAEDVESYLNGEQADKSSMEAQDMCHRKMFATLVRGSSPHTAFANCTAGAR